ncbi:uncharacterized protein LOC112519957 [Cynara cardunculus var. scolymus]|uniref:uncharacterized protein LOC112519957 n=1 Tax=Cynara cardunculus var. scolymus TaxID=59895 RepID=UPI000D62CFE0|nr:uncharacterized protein LOC112519957 [Cynara cardunculus var. scolymus]
MEIESRNELWNKLKIVFYMFRKTMAKTKLQVDLHLKLKNGKLARKAFTALLLRHHYPAYARRCTTHNIETSPQEHVLRSTTTGSKSISHHHHPDHDYHKLHQLVLEVLNDGDSGAAIEPLAVVDSPLQAEEENQVDKAAEEFINRFYKQLKQQRIASPSPN